MTDQDIINYCFTDKHGILHDHIVRNKLKNIPLNILEYLNNRYNDSESYNETVYRIKLNMDNRPVCPICGNKLTYIKSGHFTKYCSRSCTGKANINNVQEKYGVKSILCLPDIQNKTKQTLLTKYGVDNISKNDNIKIKKENTFINHFGYKNNFCNNEILNKAIEHSHNDVANNKRKLTNNIKYNHDYYLSTLKGSHISDNHKQKISIYMSSKLGQLIRSNTLSKHKTWNTSQYEEKTYQILLKYFDENDIIRQYSSNQYPWNCDFYIISKNVYIEVQCSQYHHFHPFDLNNQNDIMELNRLKTKTNTNPQYKHIIDIWTNKDIIKRNTAKENNLNYIEIWPSDNIEQIIQQIKKELLK